MSDDSTQCPESHCFLSEMKRASNANCNVRDQWDTRANAVLRQERSISKRIKGMRQLSVSENDLRAARRRGHLLWALRAPGYVSPNLTWKAGQAQPAKVGNRFRTAKVSKKFPSVLPRCGCHAGYALKANRPIGANPEKWLRSG